MGKDQVKVAARFMDHGWFKDDGCYVLFDGQFGSTGKGLLASLIAEACGERIDTVTTNAGPNSGHTGYYNGEKILTQQIPVASIVMDRMEIGHKCYLNAGSIIEPSILHRELRMYSNGTAFFFRVHPAAAIIKARHQGDQHSDIASTGKGVGPAMQDKLGRSSDAVISGCTGGLGRFIKPLPVNNLGRCFVETAQGWALGINSGFYPFVTSRECSVSQALADLGVSPRRLKKSIACLRTFPIRVGNHPDGGYSGDVYPDQEETSFEALKQLPERTTVTQRVRRIFTWSWKLYADMLRANEPDAVFINFMNYLPEKEHDVFIRDLVNSYRSVLGKKPDFVLGGFGPYNCDVRVMA